MKLVTRLAALLLLSLSLSVCAAVPPVISYQGKLMQPNGIPVPDGTYSIRFAIYDAPTGGTPLWSETNPSVQVKGGLFAVLLGSVNNLGANILDSEARYLGIEVGNDDELSPRQRVASVAASLRAGEADVSKTVLDGAITSGKLADSAITAAKVANGEITGTKLSSSAIRLGYRQVTSVQTGISSKVDLANLSVTVDVPSGGRLVKITGYGLFDSGGIGNKTCLLIYEGTTQLQLAAIYNSSAEAAGSWQSLICEVVVAASPGSHTYKLRASASAFSALCASPTTPAFILVELI